MAIRNGNKGVVPSLANDIQEGDAELVPIQSLEGTTAVTGGLEHTLRFYPKFTGTSGMFIARVHKKINSP